MNRRGEYIAPRQRSNGYQRIHLRDGTNRREEYIHRLVCAAFHGPAPSADMHAHHINGKRDDNRASNLEWLTPQENRALRNFSRGETHCSAKLTKEQVEKIRKLFPTKSNAELAAAWGVAPATIRDIRLGRTWK
jgi:hypothetical protein